MSAPRPRIPTPEQYTCSICGQVRISGRLNGKKQPYKCRECTEYEHYKSKTQKLDKARLIEAFEENGWVLNHPRKIRLVPGEAPDFARIDDAKGAMPWRR